MRISSFRKICGHQRFVMNSTILRSSIEGTSSTTLESLGLSAENTISFLTKEDKAVTDPLAPRHVKNAHYVSAKPEPVANPYVVAVSESCAETLGLSKTQCSREKFLQVFSGNELLPGLDTPYCTVYGCHSFGQWFGQLGDGRAMSLGDVKAVSGREAARYPTLELQLKGCGRSPFSRGFDGRAVLRSSIREFLASEAMFHLGVPTTRALTIIGTGELVARPWYPNASIPTDVMQDSSSSSSCSTTASDRGSRGAEKYAPRHLVQEPGAILTRVSPSFLRFAHLELHSQREEFNELLVMAEYVCWKEFPELLAEESPTGESENGDCRVIRSRLARDRLKSLAPADKADVFVKMFDKAARANAFLVAEWIRVGYVQGNMNSDNTLLGGRTLDYGPFGFVEEYNPLYQPFTSDPEGNFAFARQPQAMQVNVSTLGESIVTLVRYLFTLPSHENAASVSTEIIERIHRIVDEEFDQFVEENLSEVKRRKLGLKQWKSSDRAVWTSLEQLMTRFKCDYTIFFRLLSAASCAETVEEAIDIIQPALYPTTQREDGMVVVSMDRPAWERWFADYLGRIKEDNRDVTERLLEQNNANPKYILRNWMSALAYDRAAKGDYSVLNELLSILKNPYEEQTVDVSDRWFRKTPPWAQSMPGVSFMSCSS